MDHNLEDSLNLETDMDGMDFEHSEDAVVCQPEITLEATDHGDDIPMEFETMEDKQSLLMETGGEEVIDFMGEQLTLQEYSIGDDQTSEITTTEESNIQNILQSQSDIMVDLQFEPQTMTPTSARQDTQIQPKYIAVKVAVPSTAASNKRGEPAVLNTVTRHVAIAPKPPKLVQTMARDVYPSGKQYAIAPRPVALISNRGTITKVPMSSIVQANASKGNTVLAQVGKQLIMVPAGGSQKIKLVSAGNQSVQYLRGDPDQAQLTLNKTTATSQSSKPIVAKVVVQGSNQPAVITKLMPSSSTASPQARYVMQQKTIPISIGNNKVLLTSPTKQGKKQVITIKPPGLTPIQPQVSTTKKVVITANPTQKVILKAAPQKPAQVNKDSKVVLQPGQRSQLHKIDVPGKGIQFIRLITNPTSGPPKTSTKQSSALNISTKTLVSLTEKAMSQKPQQKFVRIAPAPAAAPPHTAQQQPIRSGQSLLTPITSSSMTSAESAVSFEEVSGLSSLVPARPSVMCKEEPEENTDEDEPQNTEDKLKCQDARSTWDVASPSTSNAGKIQSQCNVREESKSALAALIADAVADEQPAAQEVEIEYDRQESPIHDESTNSLDQMDSSARSDEHPLIVIPANYMKQGEAQDDKMEHRRIDFKFDSDPFNSFQSPSTPPPASDLELGSTELGLRPRKPCNCTKSQCLKLYCDCFANGEFCNRCNCNNCHNNLENEELRQKAIRACLDRNPNAFRPKIGKSKAGGPEIIRRHNKGCNCKRSGCLKNYCECYEAKIACTSMCKCVGCRNVEESLNRARRRDVLLPRAPRAGARHAASVLSQLKQPCSFMTSEVIEAVCQCLVAAASDGECARQPEPDPMRDVIEEFARCLQDIISASLQSTPLNLLESQT